MSEPRALPTARLEALIAALRGRGYTVIGPTERDGGVVFAEVRAVADLPVGRREEQEAGRYRLGAGVDGEVFGVVNGAGSLKPFFFAAEEPLLTLRQRRAGFAVEAVAPAAPKLAVLGVRACDLAALAMQDRIFLRGPHPDAHYAARRADVLLVAVNCTRAANTCFCVSMRTGPRAERGFDLALTELPGVFVVEAGTAAGESLLAELDLAPADAALCDEGTRRIAECADNMGRRLDTRDLPAMLAARQGDAHWAAVAQRCLSCTNCTMVCPTCFCHAVVDQTVIDGATTQRLRCWDSCFSHAHAHIVGKNFRPTVRERYRQWLTHKLGTWVEQFGDSGCVGCGRCITWCPTAIDLTAEAAALRGAPEAEP
ncbi:MAG TPA: 4Fe-4S dicluster domain-containing protein [Candidatus Dormibacteraeota bacterium]|nr:4Fe-4S dicluster domain-containing protein [Candidatus Dormibacteraeota bacterium]